MRPATHPAAQLVQLRQAEALGVLDEHHAGVRDVDPDLDHRGGHQHVQLPGGERLHGRVALVGALLAVDQPDPQLRAAPPCRRSAPPRRSPPSAPRSRRRGARPRSSGAPPPPRRRGRPRSSAARDRSRSSVRIGCRPGGRSRSVADRQVAVEGQRQRARDGRGGQRQHVRLQLPALRLERGPLRHAESMLLVDHRQSQPRRTRPPR